VTRSAIASLALAGLALGVCASPASAQSFSASFRWCPQASPAFQLRGVPKGTAKINLVMMDLDVPSFQHGGGDVPYSGQNAIPCGALSKATYSGPNPPSGAHTYRWTIKALNASGGVLAQTTAQRKFPEK
jgi:phosphatidylethanolamine-binding protein (PEBP) family uncharacterized protein